jgi:hypothetical protein
VELPDEIAASAARTLDLHKLGVKGVLFHADTFTIDRGMLEESELASVAAGCRSKGVQLHA